MPADRVTIDVEGRRLTVSNLGKVLYPTEGVTKGEVLDHYAAVAPVLLPHIASRPCTRKRWPDGVAHGSFFEKNAPRGTPTWVRTARLDSPGSTRESEIVEYVVVDDLATLVWCANLAALELHVPQWRLTRDGGRAAPDRLVVDLDPGPPADITTCARVAVVVRDLLAADGLQAFPCTSGSKGMQLYVPIRVRSVDRVRDYAARLAERARQRLPELIVATMTRAQRPGKVYVDHGQNHPGKTTISPYSLRGRELARVATPLRWSEVTDAAAGAEERGDRPDDGSGARALSFTSAGVRERLAASGDLLAPLLDRAVAGRLPG